ncbi:MAG TPA: ATP synthase F0 subunit C [Deltaproteobacteria bacterium]|nr:ATP synthase F0 subunit C [Deltaproteobacteria bacterium]
MDIGLDTVSIVKAGQYIGAGICMGFGAIGAAIGEGFVGGHANRSIGRRIGMASPFTRTMLIGQAVAETSAIFALLVAVLLIFGNFSGNGLGAWTATMSAGICMGLGALGSGIGAGYPAQEALWGSARQPALGGQMTTSMLIGQAVCQTPAIFALVIAFMLMFKNCSGIDVWPYGASLIGAGIAMGFGAIGSGWGGGMAGGKACEGIARQPRLKSSLTTLMLVGQAVSQTPAIFALLVAIMLISIGPKEGTLLTSAAMLGAGISIGLGAIGSGMGNGVNAQGACEAISKESSTTKEMLTFMLVGQAVGQTPVIFALVVSLMLMFVKFQVPANLVGFCALLAAGISMGLGAIGSGYGNGDTGESACKALASNPEGRAGILPLMLVGQAVGQTPAIFSLLVAFILMFGNYSGPATLPAAMAVLAAGISMGFGGIGPGVGNGLTAAAACEAVGYRPDERGLLMRSMLIAQAVAQSTAIYALVIAFVLVFVI